MSGIIVLILIFAVLLTILKSGILLSYLGDLVGGIENIPFIQMVVDIATSFLTGKESDFQVNVESTFFSEIVKGLIFLICYWLIGSALEWWLKVSKHEEYRDIKRIIYKPLKDFAAQYFSIIAALFVTNIYEKTIFDIFGNNMWVQIPLVILIAGAALVMCFVLLKMPFIYYIGWVLVKIVLLSVLKLLAIEFFMVFAYLILNVPGVLDQVGTGGIIIIGMMMCIFSVFGINIFEMRFDDSYYNGKRYKK